MSVSRALMLEKRPAEAGVAMPRPHERLFEFQGPADSEIFADADTKSRLKSELSRW
jgi:hypothetical protein